MSRVQLALNVADLEESIDFYTKLFGAPPAKIRDGYANFATAEVMAADTRVAGEPDDPSLAHCLRG
jgi:catechol 2,3-dioxygenase-like lactoylglutathione lyase family enzyme